MSHPKFRFTVSPKCRAECVPLPPHSCGFCNAGTTPNTFNVAIAGLTNGTCGTCSSLTGTYNLTWESGCLWANRNIKTLCAATWELTLHVNPDGSITVQLDNDPLGFGDIFIWQTAPGFVTDCSALSSTNIPPFLNQAGSCNGAAATCHVTSVGTPPAGSCEPCCKDSCTIFDDLLMGSTGVPFGWNGVSGTWTKNGSALETSDAIAILTATRRNPTPSVGTYLRVAAHSAVDGAAARLLLDYLDASNYTYFEVVFGASATANITQVIAGTPTVLAGPKSLGGGAPLTSFVMMTACVNPALGKVDASVGFSGFGLFSLTASGTFGTNDKFGLGTGTHAGKVEFVDFVSSKVGSPCPPCGSYACGGCAVAPVTFQIDISGITPGVVGACCFGFNATYIVTPNPKFNTAVQCIWDSAPIGQPCLPAVLDPDVVRLSIAYTGGNTIIAVEIDGNFATFNLTIAGHVDCPAISNLSIPPKAGTSGCITTFATCKITAL